uniref:Uncharacterized protein n=1 Tax=Anguilla anguilla TaxID=7936 RepID=A0A0E9VNF5_ANGAN
MLTVAAEVNAVFLKHSLN